MGSSDDDPVEAVREGKPSSSGFQSDKPDILKMDVLKVEDEREISAALESGLVPKFGVEGLLGLKHRQLRILTLRRALGKHWTLMTAERDARLTVERPPRDRVMSATSGDPEKGVSVPLRPRNYGELDNDVLWSAFADKDLRFRAGLESGSGRTFSDRTAELLMDELASEVDRYYDAVLRYRQIYRAASFDTLPSVDTNSSSDDFEEEPNGQTLEPFTFAGISRFRFVGIDWSKELPNSRFPPNSTVSRVRATGGRGQFISLDPCTCYDPCPPPQKWFPKMFDLPRWTKKTAKKNLYKLFRILILSLLPAGTIFILYAIPSAWGRMGLIAGESAIVVTTLSIFHDLGDKDVVTYMLGLAAVQVVFVGAVISSKDVNKN